MDQGGSCLKMLEEVRVFWLRVQEAEASNNASALSSTPMGAVRLF